MQVRDRETGFQDGAGQVRLLHNANMHCKETDAKFLAFAATQSPRGNNLLSGDSEQMKTADEDRYLENQHIAKNLRIWKRRKLWKAAKFFCPLSQD